MGTQANTPPMGNMRKHTPPDIVWDFALAIHSLRALLLRLFRQPNQPLTQRQQICRRAFPRP